VLHLGQRSREATPSSSKEVLSDITICSAKKGVMGGKTRCKQHPQGTTTTTDHDVKDYGMMRSFITSGFLIWGAELNENLGSSDTMPFPRENTIMMVHGGRPPPGMRYMSNLSPRA
jgi:hypothetical protein